MLGLARSQENSLIVMGSEVVLALYPILIKTVPTGLVTQLLSRFLTFTVLAAALAKPAAIKETWGTGAGLARSLALGSVTIAHVATSYYAFEKLSAGAAMSLFYTYPIWNLLGGALLYGESVSLYQFALVVLAFIGTLLVSQDIHEGFQDRAQTNNRQVNNRQTNWKGVAAALAAAITETIMYFGVKTTRVADPYTSTLELYPGALLGLLALLGLAPSADRPSISSSPGVWLPMTLFNVFIGFLGYAARFYAIPKVPTIVFSLLSFVGVIAAFVWGWLFVGEKPTLKTLIGAACISVAAGALGA
jgi:drug/metabolite transporter (DMT)-like permease